MSSKFDQIYNQVLAENAVPTPAPTSNINISKEVQDFFAKHQTNPGFFDELTKQIDAAQKAQQQAAQQSKQQPAQPNQQQPQAGQPAQQGQPNQQQPQAGQPAQQGQPNQQQQPKRI